MRETFVGRSDELAVLGKHLEAAATGTGGVVLVLGEPGIGKTRLAEALVRLARDRGFVSAWGRTFEGPGTPAWFPWMQIRRRLAEVPELREAVQATDLGAWESAPAGPGPAEEGPAARFALLDRFATLLYELSARRPLLLVLDDAHTADAA